MKLNQESFLRNTGPVFGSTQDKFWAKRIIIQTNALGDILNSKPKKLFQTVSKLPRKFKNSSPDLFQIPLSDISGLKEKLP